VPKKNKRRPQTKAMPTQHCHGIHHEVKPKEKRSARGEASKPGKQGHTKVQGHRRARKEPEHSNRTSEPCKQESAKETRGRTKPGRKNQAEKDPRRTRQEDHRRKRFHQAHQENKSKEGRFEDQTPSNPIPTAKETKREESTEQGIQRPKEQPIKPSKPFRLKRRETPTKPPTPSIPTPHSLPTAPTPNPPPRTPTSPSLCTNQDHKNPCQSMTNPCHKHPSTIPSPSNPIHRPPTHQSNQHQVFPTRVHGSFFQDTGSLRFDQFLPLGHVGACRYNHRVPTSQPFPTSQFPCLPLPIPFQRNAFLLLPNSRTLVPSFPTSQTFDFQFQLLSLSFSFPFPIPTSLLTPCLFNHLRTSPTSFLLPSPFHSFFLLLDTFPSPSLPHVSSLPLPREF